MNQELMWWGVESSTQWTPIIKCKFCGRYRPDDLIDCYGYCKICNDAMERNND